MPKNNMTLSRRSMLALAGAGAASVFAPHVAGAQSAGSAKLLMVSGAPLITWAPSYVAESMGYYKDEGVAIERIYIDTGPGGVTALITGAGTVAYGVPQSLLVAASRNQKLQMLMQVAAFHPLVIQISKDYAAKFGITSDMPFEKKLAIAKNFKGIRIGITAPGSATDFCARVAIRQGGVDPNTDARIVPAGSIENCLSAMASGGIDAMVVLSPTAEQAEKQLGSVVLYSVAKNEVGDYSKLAGHVLEARPADIAKNPDLYAALVRADTRGLRHIIENPDESGALLHKNTFSHLSPDIWALVWERSKSTLFKTPYIAEDRIAEFVKLGMIAGVTDPAKLNYAELIDMKFVDQAVQKTGWKVPS